MKGYRKLTACLAGMLSCSVCVGMGYIDGSQYVTVMSACVVGFLTANTLAKKP